MPGPRKRLTTAQRAELWERFKKGETVAEIARALAAPAKTLHWNLLQAGGFAPSPLRRREISLTASEREDISRGISLGHSLTNIARTLGRNTSTVTREVARNGGRSTYRAEKAEARALAQATRPKRCKLAMCSRLRAAVAAKLRRKWSPMQIAGWLKKKYADPQMHISHEIIYRSLFVQARGVLKKELQAHLRRARAMRKSKTGKAQRPGTLVDAVSISERPASVEDRAVPGHWEGDLISGSGNTHIATLVERKSRFTLLVQVDGKDTESVVSALGKQIRKLPIELRKSLTWDRGSELQDHKMLSVATDLKIYFCDPSSPWQRGSNENTNGLLRQYFPKGTSLSGHSQAALNKVARELNGRPRKTLGFDTPAETLYQTVR